MVAIAKMRQGAVRALSAIEPWYNWGRAGISSVRDETSGDGWFFEADWFGIHISIMFGRTPKQGGR